jgi:Rrf2 family protein
MLIALARAPKGESVSAANLAREQRVPYALARGILSQLARAGFLATRRGAGGGVSLSRPPEQISALSVVECLEGPLCLGLCTEDPDYCAQMGTCVMHRVWKEAEALVRAHLASRSLAYLADEQNSFESDEAGVPPRTFEEVRP